MVLRSGLDSDLSGGFGLDILLFFFLILVFIFSLLAFVLARCLSLLSSCSLPDAHPWARLLTPHSTRGYVPSEGGCDSWTGVGDVSSREKVPAIRRRELAGPPRRASTALRFGQVTSSDGDVPALPVTSCFLQLCFFLSGPHCMSSSQLCVPSTIDAGGE